MLLNNELASCRVKISTPTWPLSSRARVLKGACALAISGMLIIATPIPTNSDYDSRARYSKQEIRRAIAFYAKRYRLDPALLRAVIKVESDFRPHVISKKGAVGLMQLTPDTAVTLRVANIHDPIQNIRGGAKQLRHLLTLYDGDVRLALAAYNAGVHRVKGGKIPRIRETRAYVQKVLRHYKALRPIGTRVTSEPQRSSGADTSSQKKTRGRG